eukprot:g5900.t1
MSTCSQRESLHGLEGELFKLVSLGATSEQWAAWLKAPLQSALAGGNLELANALREAGGMGGGRGGKTSWRHPYPQRLFLRGFEPEVFSVMVPSGSRENEDWAEWLRVPLEHAAARGNLQLVDALLGAGANGGGGWRGSRGRTLLDAAALGGSPDVVTALVAAGADADVNVVSVSSRRSALYTATYCGYEACARLLVQAGANVNFQDPLSRFHVIHRAVEGGLEQLMDDLLAGGADIGARGGDCAITALHVAAYFGHEGLLCTLLAAGADKDSTDNERDTPLSLAAMRGHLRPAKALLAAGADTDTRDIEGDTPLTLAAYNGHSSIAAALLDAGANVDAVDKMGNSSLIWAASNGHLPVVEALLAAGADSDLRIALTRRAAIHQAATKGHANILSALLLNGADKDAVDIAGLSPLIMATIEGHLPVVEALLEAGANVALHIAATRRTALHCAAVGCHCGILCALMLSGADKDVVDNSWDTPLSLAAYLGHLPIVEYLLAASARMDIGRVPLICAAVAGHATIVKTLLTAGAHNGCPIDANRGHDGIGASKDTRSKHGLETLLSPRAFRDLLPIADDLPATAGVNVDAVDSVGNSSLMWAATHGHLLVVEVLLEAGADVNLRDSVVGIAAVHCAAMNGHSEVLSTLLHSGADRDARDFRGRSALVYAAMGPHLGVVEILLASGVDVSASHTVTGGDALHYAVDRGHNEMVCALLHAGADKDRVDNDGDTPLILASSRGHLSIVQTLLGAGADVHTRNTAAGRAALYRAAGKGHDEIVGILLQNGADKDVLTTNGTSPLWKAAAKGHISVVVTLVAAGADVNIPSADGSVPLHHVAGGGHVEVLSSLLRRGADVDAVDNKGRSSLAWAAKKCHLHVVERLLAAGADINMRSGYDETVPLHHAAAGGHDRILAALLFQGADKDALDAQGKSPLIWATRAGRQVDVLLAAGARVNTRSTDFQRYSALDWAVKGGDVRVVDALVSQGADIESCSFGGHRALHVAATHGQAAAVKALISAGAHMEHRTALGRTPILCACTCLTFDSLIALLDEGASVEVNDINGDTTLHWLCRAKRPGLEAVIQLLLLKGADETVLNNEGHSPADLLDVTDPMYTSWIPQTIKTRTEEERDGVRRLLAGASANRAWTRRCWLVMLRARTKEEAARGAAGNERIGEAEKEEGLRGAVAMLLGIASEDLFRTAVGFL